MNSKTKEITSALLLVLAALIWGTAFVAQKTGMDYIGPCTFNGIRSIIGFLTLIPAIMFIDKLQGKKISLFGECPDGSNMTLLKGGLYCGAILGCASLLQQIGIAHTSAGKAGFITTLYTIIVPILGIFMHRKVGLTIWLCVLATIVGMYMLCYKGDGEAINRGDAIVFLSSIVFSLHIIAIDYFAPKTDCVRMSCLQFLVSGTISIICALIFEKIDWHNVLQAYVPILYAGMLSCAVAYTLQIVGQRNVHPVVGSLLMSLESVFAALGGLVLLHERLTAREYLGCLVIFAAVIVAQLPEKKN